MFRLNIMREIKWWSMKLLLLLLLLLFVGFHRAKLADCSFCFHCIKNAWKADALSFDFSSKRNYLIEYKWVFYSALFLSHFFSVSRNKIEMNKNNCEQTQHECHLIWCHSVRAKKLVVITNMSSQIGINIWQCMRFVYVCLCVSVFSENSPENEIEPTK